MQRVELIQGFKFGNATSRIKATPDGEYLIASGNNFSSSFVVFLW